MSTVEEGKSKSSKRGLAWKTKENTMCMRCMKELCVTQETSESDERWKALTNKVAESDSELGRRTLSRPHQNNVFDSQSSYIGNVVSSSHIGRSYKHMPGSEISIEKLWLVSLSKYLQCLKMLTKLMSLLYYLIILVKSCFQFMFDSYTSLSP